MNILMLTSNDVGGVTNHILVLADALKKIDNSVNVFVGCEQGERTEEIKNHLPTFVMNFHSKNPITVANNISKLVHIIREHNINIVHCHYRSAAIYMKIVSEITGINFVWTNHLVPIPSDYIHRKLTFYGKRAIAIGVDSQKFLLTEMKLPRDKVTIVYHGVDLERFNGKLSDDKAKKIKSKYEIKDNEKVIVLLARLSREKGHEFLFNSVKNLNNVKILITGTGVESYKRELEEIIKNNKIEEKIVFTGNVDSYEILSVADVMVLPSLKEGFPLSVIESFAMKVPVVRTKMGGYGDMDRYCLGIEYGNTEALESALEKALKYDETINNMVEKAYKRVIEEWNTQNMAKKTLQVYKESI